MWNQMKKYKTKTIIEISSEDFEKEMDEFVDSLDGKVKQIILHNAPESSVEHIDEDKNKATIYYNHYEGIIIYEPATHHTKEALNAIKDKFIKIKNKIKIRNRS